MNSDQDEWILSSDDVITNQERLSRLRAIIENESAVIVEHRFYRGGRAPNRFVTDDFDDLREYLQTKTIPGDSIILWKFEDCCRNDNVVVAGKVPDASGRVPKFGSY